MMSDRREKIAARRRRAVAERDEALRRGGEIVLTGSAREIRALPNALLARLSPEEVKEALAMSRAWRGAASPAKPASPATTPFWRKIAAAPPWLQGLIGASALGLAVIALEPAVAQLYVGGPHAAPGLTDIRAWPRCLRLSSVTDRCLYRVGSGRLTWGQAAADLGMAEPALRAANPGLHAYDPLPTGAVLIIDRDAGRSR